jgi:hypothetical protein
MIAVELLVVDVVIFAIIVQCVKHCDDGTISMKKKHMPMRDRRKERINQPSLYIYLLIKTSKRIEKKMTDDEQDNRKQISSV